MIMQRRFALLLFAAIAAAAACKSTSGGARSGDSPSPATEIYVSNEASDDVTVIDAKSERVIATIPVGKRPRGIQASADGRFVFVALSGSPNAPPGVDEDSLPPPDRSQDGIGVIDTRTHHLDRVLA